MSAISKFLIDKDVDSITVEATDLDIRDLSSATDSIAAVQSGTWDIGTVGSITGDVNVTATDLDIRDLSSATDSVSAVQSGTWDIGTVGSITGDVNVTATDLDIRDLSHTQDSVKVGDGTDFLAVNADGSINVQGDLSVDDRQNTANLAQNVAISTTAVALPATPLANRERMVIQNLGPNDIEIGPAGVTFGAGLNIPKGDSIELWVGPANAVYAICNTGKSANVRILELS
jgi:hypothetical protein